VTINHGQDVTLPVKIYQWYLKFVFKQLDGVISVSSATRNASIKRGLDPNKGVVLPNGFDKLMKGELPSRETAVNFIEKEFIGNLEGKKILLTVGRQVKRKGHAWFIEDVLPKIKSDVLYLIVGSGPEFNNIQNVVEKSPIKEQIVMTGKLSKDLLNVCYAAADLFIMPNIPVPGDMEGFGIVLL
jgi:phosphatidylinositol alpha-1,6-mannosyltransferase